MKKEVPTANPPLNFKEKSAVARLRDVDLQVIDATILASTSARWSKVARVVVSTEDALRKHHPDLSYIFYALRVRQLVDEGRLDSQGNLLYMRFSEVRLPMLSSSDNGA